MISKPSVAVRNIAVFGINLETVDLPEEEYGKYEMGELVRKFHQPPEIVP